MEHVQFGWTTVPRTRDMLKGLKENSEEKSGQALPAKFSSK